MPVEYLLLAAIGFLGSIVFGATGFGAALVAMPIAVHLVPLPFALAVYALADVANSFSVGLEKPKNAVRGEYLRLVPMILAGTALGVTLLVNLPRAVGMLLLGVFVIGFALYTLRPHARQRIVSSAWAWAAGFAGGITSTLFGAGGPPYAIYLSQRGLSKAQFRATLGLATLTSISLRLVAFVLTGLLLDAKVWLTALAAVPGCLLGIWIARRIFARISRDALMRAVAVLLLATGASLIFRAVA